MLLHVLYVFLCDFGREFHDLKPIFIAFLYIVRYPDIPEEDIKKACPVCRGNCNCRLCLSGDNLIKVVLMMESVSFIN